MKVGMLSEILVPFEEGDDELSVIPVEWIKQKVLRVGRYLAMSSNPYEINL